MNYLIDFALYMLLFIILVVIVRAVEVYFEARRHVSSDNSLQPASRHTSHKRVA